MSELKPTNAMANSDYVEINLRFIFLKNFGYVQDMSRLPRGNLEPIRVNLQCGDYLKVILTGASQCVSL